MRMPLNSSSASTPISGTSTSSYRGAVHRIETGLQQVAETQGDVGIFAGILGHTLGGHLVHAQLVLPVLADQIGDGDHLMIQITPGEVFETMAALTGMQEVVGYHGIARHAGNFHSLKPQKQLVELDVLIDLGHLRVREDRSELLARLFGIEKGAVLRPSNRQIPGLARLPGEGITDHLRARAVESRGLQVKGDPPLLFQLGHERRELLGCIHEVIRVDSQG